MSEEIFRALSEKDLYEEGVAEVKDGEIEVAKEEVWTVSTKTRRLAPAFTLSRKDLGADSARNIAHDNSAAKKKVIRFSRDDMLRLWKPTKILSSMTELADMISISSLEPSSLQPLGQDEVIQLWNSDKDRNKDGARGRGRGRGKGVDGEEEDGGDDNEWSRGRLNGEKVDGPWDDVDGSATTLGLRGLGGGLDLADFAAAALKFRTDTRGLGLMDLMDGNKPKIVEEDEMERLLREQKESVGIENMEDDEAEPEWADAYLGDTTQAAAPTHSANDSRNKRNLLFETLNIHNSGTSDPDLLKHYTVRTILTDKHLMAPPSSSPPHVVPESWYYRDPQNTVQGPYETASMRQWHEARYFTPDLPIKLAHWHEFHSLGAVFPDSDFAFSPDTAISEPFTAPPRHSHLHDLGPPPMRPLQSEIMDIDIILRQQQEQRQQQQQRLEEQRRVEIAQTQMQRAADELKEAEKLQQQQLQQQLQQQQQQQIRQQLFEMQEKEKTRQIHYEQQQQQQQILQQQLQQQQQQILLRQQRQDQLALQQQQHQQQQQQQLEEEERNQKAAAQELKEQQLREQKQRQQQQLQQQHLQQQQQLQLQQQQMQQQDIIQKQSLLQQQQQSQRLLPSSSAPAVSAWGSSAVTSPSLAQIQTEESKLRQQQPSRGSSLQLKSLLGLSSTPSQSAAAAGGAEPNAWESASVPSSASASLPSPSLKEILRQEQAKQHEQAQLKHHQAQLLMQQQVRTAREIAASESATAAVIAAASWSAVGAGTGTGAGAESSGRGSAPKAALSLRDIMQLEEASSAASQSPAAPSDSPFASAPRPAPGSWAAKASLSASGGGGGGGAPLTTNSRQSAAVASKSTSSSSATKKPPSALAVAPAPIVALTPPPAAGPSFGSGHKCPASELSEWCVAQLTKIRAADSSSSAADPSEFFGVLEYCATLESAVEVRETFSAYLGSTTMVSNFASEFLKKKDGQSPSAAGSLTGTSSGPGGGGATVVKKKGRKGNSEF